jgi:hypothetical protein
METKNALLRADYWVQTIMGIGLIVCCCSVVGIWVALMGLVPFGGWQVLSGLIFGLGYQDSRRLKYLGIVIAYFLLMFLNNNIRYEFTWPLLVVIPPVLAIWYYVVTRREYYNIKVETEDAPQYENILDA